MNVLCSKKLLNNNINNMAGFCLQGIMKKNIYRYYGKLGGMGWQSSMGKEKIIILQLEKKSVMREKKGYG